MDPQGIPLNRLLPLAALALFAAAALFATFTERGMYCLWKYGWGTIPGDVMLEFTSSSELEDMKGLVGKSIAQARVTGFVPDAQAGGIRPEIRRSADRELYWLYGFMLIEVRQGVIVHTSLIKG